MAAARIGTGNSTAQSGRATRVAISGELATVATVMVMVCSVAYSLVYAGWMPGLDGLVTVAFLAVLAGLALAHSSFPTWTAHLTSMIYGLFVIGVSAGSRADIARLNDWRERFYLMVDKVTVWAHEAMSNGSSRETLIFYLVLSALFWLIGYGAVWYSLRTRRIWHVILPAGVTLFSNVYYYAGNKPMGLFLVLYLVCCVVLLALSHVADREERWARERVRVNASLRGGFVLTGLVIALVALLFSWRVTVAMTSPAAREWFGQLNEPYNEALARWNRLFSSLQNPIARPLDNYRDEFSLSGPRNLSPETVMEVSARPARYFWRAASYDAYDGHTWRNTVNTELDLPANDSSLPLTAYEARTTVAASFALQRGTDSVYVPSQPVRVGVPARAVVDAPLAASVELSQFKVTSMLLPGNRYAALGSMSTARINQLREAGTDYPAWMAKYRQLPEISGRVLDLAANLTRNAATPYDKAVAVESWLRKNIAYDEKLEAPPPGREGADYTLFETHRAYCTYYATSMVMLLRAQGVPARIAVGYAQGAVTLSPAGTDFATYLVRQQDSHAWVEVYFPRYGWVEFEPTASQPLIPRSEDLPQITPTPEGQPPTATPDALGPTATPDPPLPTPTTTPGPARANVPPPPPPAQPLTRLWDTLRDSPLLWLLFLPLLLALLWSALRIAERAGFGHLPPLARAYGMLTRWAGWLGVGRDREHTPYQQAEALAQRAPEAADAARRITDLYVEERFGRRPQSSPAGLEALAAIQSARTRLRKAWLRGRLRGKKDGSEE